MLEILLISKISCYDIEITNDMNMSTDIYVKINKVYLNNK
jgi:hypothetical protein